MSTKKLLGAIPHLWGDWGYTGTSRGIRPKFTTCNFMSFLDDRPPLNGDCRIIDGSDSGILINEGTECVTIKACTFSGFQEAVVNGSVAVDISIEDCSILSTNAPENAILIGNGGTLTILRTCFSKGMSKDGSFIDIHSKATKMQLVTITRAESTVSHFITAVSDEISVSQFNSSHCTNPNELIDLSTTKSLTFEQTALVRSTATYQLLIDITTSENLIDSLVISRSTSPSSSSYNGIFHIASGDLVVTRVYSLDLLVDVSLCETDAVLVFADCHFIGNQVIRDQVSFYLLHVYNQNSPPITPYIIYLNVPECPTNPVHQTQMPTHENKPTMYVEIVFTCLAGVVLGVGVFFGIYFAARAIRTCRQNSKM